MFRKVKLATCLFVASIGGIPHAQAQTYPPAVNKVIAEARAACDSAQKFKVNPGGIERVDVFGRGKRDYILSDDSWTCEGSGAMFSGSGGSTVWIVSDIKGDYSVVLENLVRDINYDRKGGLILSLHGSACDRAGYQNCTERMRWNGQRFISLGKR